MKKKKKYTTSSQRKHVGRSLKRISDVKGSRACSADENYRARLIELRKNIRSFSELIDNHTIGLSDTLTLVGESAPQAKYTNHEILLAIDLRLDGLSLRQISLKTEIPIRTLRDIYSGKRRAVMPTVFRQCADQNKKR